MKILQKLISGMKKYARLGTTLFPQTNERIIDQQSNSHSEEEQKKIKEIILQYDAMFVNMHNLQTRRVGQEMFIEFHLTVRGNVPAHNAHTLLDIIKEALFKAYPHANVIIYLEQEANNSSGTSSTRIRGRKFGRG